MAGIGTRPVIADFMNQIGQSDRRVLACDEWLRVKNCEGAFGVGDCASIEQRRIVEDVAYLFKLADKDNSGTLSAEEFVETMEQVRQRYPQIDIYMDRQQMKGVLGLLADALSGHQSSSMALDIEHFKQAISKVYICASWLPPGVFKFSATNVKNFGEEPHHYSDP